MGLLHGRNPIYSAKGTIHLIVEAFQGYTSRILEWSTLSSLIILDQHSLSSKAGWMFYIAFLNIFMVEM